MKRLLLVCMSLFAATIHAKPCNEVNSVAFIAGTYTVIGREPDSGKTYSGTILIENSNDKIVRMVESVDQQPKRIWRGKFRAAVPGEGCVLVVESKQGSMACLVSTDLDNYARITCLSKSNNKPNKILGLLSMFPVINRE